MAKKTKLELSNIAQKTLDDVTGLTGRLNTYLKNIKASNPNFKDERSLFQSAAISVLEGLGAEIIHNNLPNSEVVNLIDSINRNTKACVNLTNEPKEKEKIEFHAARGEAALKGFALPLSLGGTLDVVKGKMTKPIKDEDCLTAMEATKQAMKDLWNQNIPTEKYPEALINKTAAILKDDSRKFSKEQLSQFNEFITKGVKVQNPPKINHKELELIKDSTSRTVNYFIKSFDSNTATIKNSENQIDKILEQSLNDLQSRRYKVSEPTKKLLAENLREELLKLDPEYLKTHSKELSKEFSASLRANRPWRSLFSSNYEIAEPTLKQRVTLALSKKHLPLSQTEAANRLKESSLQVKSKPKLPEVSRIEHEQRKLGQSSKTLETQKIVKNKKTQQYKKPQQSSAVTAPPTDSPNKRKMVEKISSEIAAKRNKSSNFSR